MKTLILFTVLLLPVVSIGLRSDYNLNELSNSMNISTLYSSPDSDISTSSGDKSKGKINSVSETITMSPIKRKSSTHHRRDWPARFRFLT